MRQRPLPLLGEEALGLELLLQLLERLEQRALAGGLDAIADELQLPARRPVRRLSAHSYACSVLDQSTPARGHLRAIEDHVDRGVLLLVLHAEVHVPARGRARAADLALDPELGDERALERAADHAPELGDREDAWLGLRRRRRTGRQRRRRPHGLCRTWSRRRSRPGDGGHRPRRLDRRRLAQRLGLPGRRLRLRGRGRRRLLLDALLDWREVPVEGERLAGSRTLLGHVPQACSTSKTRTPRFFFSCSVQ